MQVFAGPLAGGARAVVMANFQTTQTQYPMSNVTVYWEQLGLRRDQAATVRDVYGGGPGCREWAASAAGWAPLNEPLCMQPQAGVLSAMVEPRCMLALLR